MLDFISGGEGPVYKRNYYRLPADKKWRLVPTRWPRSHWGAARTAALRNRDKAGDPPPSVDVCGEGSDYYTRVYVTPNLLSTPGASSMSDVNRFPKDEKTPWRKPKLKKRSPWGLKSRKREICLDPDSMHGAGDGFGGSDF